MRLRIATLLLCLLVPFKAEAKPMRHAVDEFAGDRLMMLAQAGTTAVDVNRAMRCPAPVSSTCRDKRVRKHKPWRKRKRPEPGVVAPLKVSAAPVRAVPLPRARPHDAPQADEEQAIFNGTWNRIAVALHTDEAPRVIRATLPLVRINLFEGFVREIADAVAGIGASADEHRKLGLIMKHESGGRNVMNYVARARRLSPKTRYGYTAQGYYQILNSNWRRLSGRLGIRSSNAMAASFQDQSRVALALLREGVGHWTKFNPSLRAALTGKRTRYARHRRQHYASAR